MEISPEKEKKKQPKIPDIQLVEITEPVIVIPDIGQGLSGKTRYETTFSVSSVEFKYLCSLKPEEENGEYSFDPINPKMVSVNFAGEILHTKEINPTEKQKNLEKWLNFIQNQFKNGVYIINLQIVPSEYFGFFKRYFPLVANEFFRRKGDLNQDYYNVTLLNPAIAQQDTFKFNKAYIIPETKQIINDVDCTVYGNQVSVFELTDIVFVMGNYYGHWLSSPQSRKDNANHAKSEMQKIVNEVQAQNPDKKVIDLSAGDMNPRGEFYNNSNKKFIPANIWFALFNLEIRVLDILQDPLQKLSKSDEQKIKEIAIWFLQWLSQQDNKQSRYRLHDAVSSLMLNGKKARTLDELKIIYGENLVTNGKTTFLAEDSLPKIFTELVKKIGLAKLLKILKFVEGTTIDAGFTTNPSQNWNVETLNSDLPTDHIPILLQTRI